MMYCIYLLDNLDYLWASELTEQETKQIDTKSVGNISRVVMAFLKV